MPSTTRGQTKQLAGDNFRQYYFDQDETESDSDESLLDQPSEAVVQDESQDKATLKTSPIEKYDGTQVVSSTLGEVISHEQFEALALEVKSLSELGKDPEFLLGVYKEFCKPFQSDDRHAHQIFKSVNRDFFKILKPLFGKSFVTRTLLRINKDGNLFMGCIQAIPEEKYKRKHPWRLYDENSYTLDFLRSRKIHADLAVKVSYLEELTEYAAFHPTCYFRINPENNTPEVLLVYKHDEPIAQKIKEAAARQVAKRKSDDAAPVAKRVRTVDAEPVTEARPVEMLAPHGNEVNAPSNRLPSACSVSSHTPSRTPFDEIMLEVANRYRIWSPIAGLSVPKAADGDTPEESLSLASESRKPF